MVTACLSGNDGGIRSDVADGEDSHTDKLEREVHLVLGVGRIGSDHGGQFVLREPVAGVVSGARFEVTGLEVKIGFRNFSAEFRLFGVELFIASP